ncbi:hypothetical protein [Streptomyces djakartensis]|uniref:Uncharacterized protein n=1 Tax=Streptomyces djakartensis TaxID=68193 RepID=A0ABQ2ZVU4_9ACTN|nr:hypothetical protein [Streptomyces djakartensis]GGY27517.1 hypothetical protein GCM10010384_38280 [Streptomyces djakartensis]
MADHLEQEEPSWVAGAVVLAALGGGALAVVFALAVEAGVLAVWVAAVAAVWWSARRRVPDSSATPPPQEGRPSCRECAGHELIDVTPSETQKGMLIYKSAPPDRPNHTHIHIVEEVNPR